MNDTAIKTITLKEIDFISLTQVYGNGNTFYLWEVNLLERNDSFVLKFRNESELFRQSVFIHLMLETFGVTVERIKFAEWMSLIRESAKGMIVV